MTEIDDFMDQEGPVLTIQDVDGRHSIWADLTYSRSYPTGDGWVSTEVWPSVQASKDDPPYDCPECGASKSVEVPDLIISTADKPSCVHCPVCATEWEYRQDGTHMVDGKELPIMAWVKVER